MSYYNHDRLLRRLIGVLFLLALGGAVWAQQLTTVAVFDLDRVLLNFYQDSSAVRQYRDAEQRFRNDLQRAEQQLNDYQARRARALDRNDSRTAQRLREDIQALEEEIVALREGWYAQQEELQDELGGDEFNQRLYDTIGFVAADNGYTAVLESTQLGTALFWYSPEIDITDMIIQELLARFR